MQPVGGYKAWVTIPGHGSELDDFYNLGGDWDAKSNYQLTDSVFAKSAVGFKAGTAGWKFGGSTNMTQEAKRTMSVPGAGAWIGPNLNKGIDVQIEHRRYHDVLCINGFCFDDGEETDPFQWTGGSTPNGPFDAESRQGQFQSTDTFMPYGTEITFAIASGSDHEYSLSLDGSSYSVPAQVDYQYVSGNSSESKMTWHAITQDGSVYHYLFVSASDTGVGIAPSSDPGAAWTYSSTTPLSGGSCC
jgi:hypothetical protein